jgi:hypothetical protein
VRIGKYVLAFFLFVGMGGAGFALPGTQHAKQDAAKKTAQNTSMTKKAPKKTDHAVQKATNKGGQKTKHSTQKGSKQG